MKNRIPILKFSALMLILHICTGAQVKLPSFISDGMVLQRDIEIPLWGWASPGEKIEVQFMDNCCNTVAGTNGKWMLKLPPQKAGGPYKMTIIASDTINLMNVLIGDVWLCSGQSNMEFEIYKASEKYASEIKSSANDWIRQFLVKRRISFNRHDDVLTDAGWQPANPQNVLNFSAVAYFFARNLYEKYRIPIGLINSSYGGTPAESWVNEDVLKNYPAYYAKAVLYKDSVIVDSISKKDKLFTDRWFHEINGNDIGIKERWMSQAFDSGEWETMQIPNLWQKNGLKDITGAVVWFRKEIDIPGHLAGKDAVLHLGAIVARDSTYFNGVNIGSATNKYVRRVYKIDGSLIKPGKNLIAVRVLNENGDGGFIPEKNYKLEIGGTEIDIKGSWQYKLSASARPLLRDDVTRFQGQGASMYYGMLSPLAGYGIKGTIWYQGEANKGRGIEYRTLFQDLIKSWRKEWGQGDFPFLFVQIANIDEARPDPYDSRLAELQEAQAMALALPNTGMASANDLGEWNDIHPLNKADVGYRLFLNAMKIAYHEKNTVHSGPVYRSMKIDGNKVIITFNNTGSGLIVKGGGKLKHFAVADTSHKYVWAEAEIRGNKVIVWNSSINAPAAVRYAWADNPEGANLYNKEGLPALPFRTDIPE